ncbi:MAG: cysteate synthase [Prolixibacteraceae bacterium]|nr:cysteate synthase [Prolixibacteraceae bacterium]MBN2649817.1 cysteate synthase [Prolixibacteraceae bacterium]
MKKFKPTVYKLQSLCCDTIFDDTDWELNCPHNEKPALVRAIYDKKQIEINNNLPGLYKFADWLPINRILEGSGAPITYKSKGLAKELGLTNLFITFNGYWPEKGAHMQTGTFKECEAYSVCARKNQRHDKVMVVASAGNTSRAFAKVCSDNKIPLLLCVPEDNLSSMWFETELDPCVKLVSTASGSDYFDAIHLSNIAAEMDLFYPEGGAKNVARRDGMGLTVVSAVTTIGRIPDYYFQAIGSGTGAIAAWEANLRFLEDGRFGNRKMKLMVSQNEPFVPIKDAWEAQSRNLLPFDDNDARKQVEIVNAKVLTNRRPPYSLIGGLYDALSDTNGEVLSASNEEAEKAAQLFLETEGNDVTSAAAVAVASLIDSVKKGKVEKNATIVLNITGGGTEKFKSEHQLHYLKPSIIFPIDPDPEDVKTKLAKLFEE